MRDCFGEEEGRVEPTSCAWRLNRYFWSPLTQMDAEQVTERDISNYIDSRLSAGRRETTVNRELQYLGQALRLAKRRKLLKEIPFIEKFSEKDNARQGFFEDADVERLVSFLPEDLKDYVRFGYLTGWRKGEVSQLTWQHVEGNTIRLPPRSRKIKMGGY